ncbi:autotransporter outer membrane beta-barrel domain-containing protein [uncultured Dialister sp.]|uniref:autotransporter outer membrane beta-barrel domain-containing protein n=1 Tax=uncultured Dialister sp. TaxID=278064 RepID=UPI0025D05924|nr:autotransporter outer membrane beta-barrel domain-containing protein [uncultured Dialister sp.]
MPAEAAAERSAPLTVTDKNQTVSDNFDVTVKDGSSDAVLGIASTAAADDKGVTAVNSQIINGTFTVGGSKGNVAEANGIWVQDNYPGTVKLADGLNIKVDTVGNYYNASGIYLEGVDTHHGMLGESYEANDEYTNKYNGHISPTSVHVGDGTTITVHANAPGGNPGDFLNAVALENHFGHMIVGNNVTVSTETEAFKENYSHGFAQLFYGDTSIGNYFSATMKAVADADTQVSRNYALYSRHDHQNDDSNMQALTQNRLVLGDDAHLVSSVKVAAKNDSKQEVANGGAYLSRTDFSIGKGMMVTVSQEGVDKVSEVTAPSSASYVVGLYTRGAGSSQNPSRIGEGLRNEVIVNKRKLNFIDGFHVSGWNETYGEKPDLKDSSHIEVGEGSYTGIQSYDSSAVDISGIGLNSDSALTLKKDGEISIRKERGYAVNIHGIYLLDQSAMNLEKDEKVYIIQNGGKSSNIYGMDAYGGSMISAADGLQFIIDSTGDAEKSNTFGIYNYLKSNLTVGDDSTVSVAVTNTSKETKSSVVSGIRNILADSSFGDDFHVQVQAVNYENAEGIRNTGVDLNSGNQKNGAPANMTIGDNLSVTVKASDLSNGGAPIVEGIRNGTNHLAGYTFTDGKNTMLTVGKNAHITVTAPDKVTDVSALHSFNHANAEIGDDAVLTVNSHAQNSKDKILNNVVKADDAGHIIFDGGLNLAGTQNAIYSTDKGSLVKAMGDGRKVILGDLKSADNGSIRLNLNTADSLLRGKSTVDGFKSDEAESIVTHGLMAAADAADESNSGTTELTIANGAHWDMTASSQVTKLVHENSGVVNMAYNPDLQRLDVGTYSGKDGVFRMKSDLNELETADKLYADKVYIDKAMEGSTGFIQVHDQSFLTGHEVTGTKYQLLVTDESRKAKFSGLTLDEGGLWDVTPTIQNGAYVRDVMGVTNANEKQWYLTKLERKVNKDTIPLMKAAGNSYALYRLDIDSLRKRMGDLRFRNLKDTSGLWARDFHGAYEGRGVYSKYNGFQLGYDYAANDKSVYGFFAERNISNPKYSYGSSKDHGLSGGLYGTWLGDSGLYTDVVAKWGRNDTELRTRGGWPDSANYRTWNESLSVEFGKTFTRDNGFFLEPEAQMVFGRLGSKDYTTRRGRTVSMGSYDSAIGRLGILLGKRVTDRENPYDYYLKFSVLHEFGGERNFHLAAPDGETFDYSENYRDTWEEAGFGGTWHINGNTSLYADAERSFGGMWHKKWQWNVGVNWQF